ncbi:MAG TPA: hypothetical protein VMM16_11860 [Verrucomicrobiae bacterium]|nr:hypothetical protein [Verrucomicrobiae bacterium]
MIRTRTSAILLSALVLSLVAVWLAGASPTPAKTGNCDRACLNGFVDQYMAAVAAHDPSKLPHSANIRYTENNVEMPLGEGLWQTSDGWGTYKVYIDDPQAGQVGFLAVANEDGHLSCFAGRLKVAGRKVTEIEIIAARPDNPGPRGAGPLTGGPENLHDKPLFSEDEPASERVSREKLIQLASGYFDTIQLNTGKIYTTFDPDCQRMENGSVTANNPNATNPVAKMGCQAQLETGLLKIVTRARDRRFVVDEQRQMVYVATFFDHNGTVRQNKLVDGSVRTIGAPFDRPYTFLIFELFKIKDGKIRQIEAVLTTVPYYMPSPWVAHKK